MAQSPHTGGERGIVPDWRAIGITRRLEVHDQAFAGGCLGFFILSKAQRTLAHNDLEVVLLGEPIAHVTRMVKKLRLFGNSRDS